MLIVSFPHLVVGVQQRNERTPQQRRSVTNREVRTRASMKQKLVGILKMGPIPNRTNRVTPMTRLEKRREKVEQRVKKRTTKTRKCDLMHWWS